MTNPKIIRPFSECGLLSPPPAYCHLIDDKLREEWAAIERVASAGEPGADPESVINPSL
jgi:hypothetical protein